MGVGRCKSRLLLKVNMAQYKSVSQWAKRLGKDIDVSRKQALNRAIVTARTQYVRTVKADTGLSKDKLLRRTKTERKANDQGITLNIGTLVWFRMAEFTTKIVKVMSSRGKRLGASFKTPSTGYTLIPKAFIAKGKNSDKQIVVERYGTERYKLKNTTVDSFQKSVEKNRDTILKAMVDSFKKNFSSKLSFNRSK